MTTRRSFLACLLALLGSLPLFGADTVLFVVRHAEKASETEDTDLSEAGKKRAVQLMEALKHLRIDAVYVTDKLRARKTALPLCEAMGIMPKTYTDYSQASIDAMVAEQSGKRVLIVGHSTTVHEIVQCASGKTTAPIGEHFDNLFVIAISGSEKSVVQLKYGESN